MDGRMDRRMNGGGTGGWTDRWTGGWLVGCMDGWTENRDDGPQTAAEMRRSRRARGGHSSDQQLS